MIVLDANVTCADMDTTCLQLLGMCVSSGCDTTFAEGKISALNTWLADEYPVLADVLSKYGTTQQHM